MPVITKALAEDTAKKLKTRPKNPSLPQLHVLEVRAGAHLMQQVWCNGQFVVQFGIKHASNRNNPHGWIARDLDLSPHKAHNFAVCNMSIDAMIEHLIAQGMIESDEHEVVS